VLHAPPAYLQSFSCVLALPASAASYVQLKMSPMVQQPTMFALGQCATTTPPLEVHVAVSIAEAHTPRATKLQTTALPASSPPSALPLSAPPPPLPEPLPLPELLPLLLPELLPLLLPEELPLLLPELLPEELPPLLPELLPLLEPPPLPPLLHAAPAPREATAVTTPTRPMPSKRFIG
jgi:hypothetical protein